MCALAHYTGLSRLLTVVVGQDRATVRNALALAPNPEPASCLSSVTHRESFLRCKMLMERKDLFSCRQRGRVVKRAVMVIIWSQFKTLLLTPFSSFFKTLYGTFLCMAVLQVVLKEKSYLYKAKKQNKKF